MIPNTILELQKRKSVRAYLDKEIEQNIKEEILNACIQAPSAGNMCLYSIIDVTKQETKDELSILCDNQPFIKNSKMTLVFLADSTRWYKMYNEYLENDKEIKPTLADYFLGVNDAIIAAQNAVVAAEAYGIGSCYIGDIVENYEKIKELFNLPKYVVPVCLLVFGYPTLQQLERNKPKRLDIKDMVFENNYVDPTKEEVFQIFIKQIKKDYPDLDEKLLNEKTIEKINNLFKRKQNTPFFQEMNRSLNLIMKEFN